MPGTNDPYKPETYDRNLDSFEFGAHFTDQDIREEIARDGLAAFWTFRVVKEALSDGFDLVDTDGEKLPVMDKFNDFFETTRYLQEMMQFIAYIRAYGKSGLLHFADGSIKAFEPRWMFLDYDLKNRKFNEIELQEWSVYHDDFVTHSTAKGSEALFNLKFFVFGIFEEKSKTLQGQSVLEPIWDYLQGLNVCNFLSPLIVAQSSGVKIMKSVHFKPNLTAEQKEAMLRPLRESSYKLTIGMGMNDEFEIKHAPNNTFIDQTTELLYSALAASTGYPKEAWRGNQVGTTSGASQTEAKILEIHKTIQKEASPLYKESVKLIAELKGYTLPDKFTIDWRFKESMSEDQEADLLVKQAQAVQGLAPILTGNELREKYGYPKLDHFDDTIPLSESQNQGMDININDPSGFLQENEQGDIENEPNKRNPNNIRRTNQQEPIISTR